MRGVNIIVFEDGVAHAVRVVDDAPHGFRPMCGKALTKPRAKPVEEAEEFCLACIPLMCGELGLDAEDFMANVKENARES